MMEKENKKLRDASKKKRNETVRVINTLHVLSDVAVNDHSYSKQKWPILH